MALAKAPPTIQDGHVALLRGINVGGKRKLPMKDLKAMFLDAGCNRVETYIQSGNAVFEAPPDQARAIADRVEAAIEAQFGFTSPIVLRSAAEMQAVVASNPFLQDGIATDLLYVAFLKDEPTAEAVAQLDPQRSPPDAFAVRGGDIYLHFLGGVADSKLTNAYFDAKLKTISTARNWRTVLTLLAMSGG